MNQSNTIAKGILQELAKGVSLEKALSSTKIILQKYKLEALYTNVLQSLEREVIKEKARQTLYIRTPYELSDSLLQTITKQIVSAEGTDRIQIIDKELLAGFKATLGGYVYDASAKKYIERLRNLKNK